MTNPAKRLEGRSYTASGQAPRCYCCDNRFRPRRHRYLCDACHKSISDLALKTPEQVRSVQRALTITLARIEIAKDWPPKDELGS